MNYLIQLTKLNFKNLLKITIKIIIMNVLIINGFPDQTKYFDIFEDFVKQIKKVYYLLII